MGTSLVFPGLPSEPWVARKPLRVCIVSEDLIGPVKNGGIGTAYSTLAEALSRAGMHVTLLFANVGYSGDKPIEFWIQEYSKKNIEFIRLPFNKEPIWEQNSYFLASSYMVYQWLLKRDFDVIHFPEWHGKGFYSILAKHQGLAFQNTLICVGTHSPTLWHKEGNLDFIDSENDLTLDFMERQCVSKADVVICPSQYMLNWMTDNRWELPKRTYVHQNVLPIAARKEKQKDEKLPRKIKEIVFFGRLEPRKGLILFCDALDRLIASKELGFSVTFLGKSIQFMGISSEEYIHERSKKWPWDVKILNDLGQSEAVEYLSKPDRLAVISSLIDNSPYTVLECLGAQIPFLATNVGGIPELLSEKDREKVCFLPKPDILSKKIQEALINGITPCPPAMDFSVVEKKWVQWHLGLAEKHLRLKVDLKGTVNWNPLVSVCLVTFNRPEYLSQAIDSLIVQTYKNFEIVLVDDGSNKKEAIDYLEKIKPEFETRGWQIIQQTNSYLGAARNNAARHSNGQYLLFMDDDNVAKPDEIEKFVLAAYKSKADILTTVIEWFSGSESPLVNPKSQPKTELNYWLPIGGSVDFGLIKNCFGDANALIKREVFEALGGFTEDYGVGHEDWEFFASAALNGYRIEVVPEALFHYRMSTQGMLRSGNIYANRMRSIRPYLNAVPPSLRNIIVFAQAVKYQNDELRTDLNSRGVEEEIQNELFTFSIKTVEQLVNNGFKIDALRMLPDILEIVKRTKNGSFYLACLTDVVIFLVKINEFKIAIPYLEKSLQLAKKLNNQTLIERNTEIKLMIINKLNEEINNANDVYQKILESNDVMEAVDKYQGLFNDELVFMIQKNAEMERQEGNTELAIGLENLAYVVKERLSLSQAK
jgi:O-antigen biosynthesis protein